METGYALDALRHSAAHLLAHAVLELFPTTKLTIGPVTEEGFFYDFLPERNFKEEDLAVIEDRMRAIASRDFAIVHKTVHKREARELFKNNLFKLELINAIEGDDVGMSLQGDFFDLCRGGHVASTGQLKHFKLLAISGSYWRADKNNQALQRINGIIFPTAEELERYEHAKQEAATFDHRKIGKQQDLFSFNDVAAGFPFFHGKGLIIYNTLIEYMRSQQRRDYQEIKTPLIMSEVLWKTSGHYDHYRDKMYYTAVDEEAYCIRPMNCPGGITIYKERPRSYRDLPLRFAEFGLVHRHELSGVLHGLFRVRAFTVDDAHIFCIPDQLEGEITKVINLARTTYARFGFKKIFMSLATKPEESMGSQELWDTATEALRKALIANNVTYTVNEGDGAFYGPKVDMYIEDAMGRKWQCGTVQVDFFMPQKFNLVYVAPDQSRQVPVIVHRAIYGSLERFMGTLIEHHKGNLPFWLSPVQVKVLTVTDEQKEYARTLCENLDTLGIRCVVDESSDPLSGQIKTAQLEKIPLMLVVGKKESAERTITARYRDGVQVVGMSLDKLKELIESLRTCWS